MHRFIWNCFSAYLIEKFFLLFGCLETACFFLARKVIFRTFLEFIAILWLKEKSLGAMFLWHLVFLAFWTGQFWDSSRIIQHLAFLVTIHEMSIVPHPLWPLKTLEHSQISWMRIRRYYFQVRNHQAIEVLNIYETI